MIPTSLQQLVTFLLPFIIQLQHQPSSACYTYGSQDDDPSNIIPLDKNRPPQPPLTMDPCMNVQCPPGARCVPKIGPLGSQSAPRAECKCPTRCPSYGDNAGSRPVCGSDGRDYTNLCQLRRAACHLKTDIRIKYQGTCDPCAMQPCNEGGVCQLDTRRQPICRCSTICNLEFKPVCASDGRTYANQCIMEVEGCKAKKNLRIIYKGECSGGPNPCQSVNCLPGEECEINAFGEAFCKCPDECDPVMRPVCGTDGISYDSACHLRRSACLKRLNTAVAYHGLCGESSTGMFDHHLLMSGGVGGAGMMPGGATAGMGGYGMGGFGVNFGSNNNMAQHSLQPTLVKLAGTTSQQQHGLQHQQSVHGGGPSLQAPSVHGGMMGTIGQGLKDPCYGYICSVGKMCEVNDITGMPSCECPRLSTCPMHLMDPVCGSDGITYGNECRLKVESCAAGQLNVTAVHRGACRERLLIAVPPKTVKDPCLNVKCEFYAECKPIAGGTRTECICRTDCPMSEQKVCGTDGTTYKNECELKAKACEKGKYIRIQHQGRCDPCREITCKYGAKCRNGQCVCPTRCPPTRDPVCGSDKITYPNTCLLQQASCKKNFSVTPLNLGPCEDLRDSSPYSREIPFVDEPALASCRNSEFGCCKDNKTPAKGQLLAGCPETCDCNPLGATSSSCDAKSGQCKCQPGVGGKKCDRCKPGFWGLPRSPTFPPRGCTPCGCSLYGSVRDDCEQMTGRCVCKQGVHGLRCDACPRGQELTITGCVSTHLIGNKNSKWQSSSGAINHGRGSSAAAGPDAEDGCDSLQCLSHAICKVVDGSPQCVCKWDCNEEDKRDATVVCGSDGRTYKNHCALKRQACKSQKDIVLAQFGACARPRTMASTNLDEQTSLEESHHHQYQNFSNKRSARNLIYGWHGQTDNVDDQATPSGTSTSTRLNRRQLEHYGEAQVVPKMRHHGPSARTSYVNLESQADAADNHVSDNEGHNWFSKPSKINAACDATPDCVHTVGLENSACVRGRCQCMPPFYPSPDGQQGMTCSIDGGTGYSGGSYTILPSLKSNARLDIAMTFKTYATDGLILYSQQNEHGRGDFISIAVVHGQVEFRFNLGSGPVALRSQLPLTLGQWHKVTAKRYQRDGLLIVDDESGVAQRSPGHLSTLNLDKEALYIGGFPWGKDKSLAKRIANNIGTKRGLVGCIQKLSLNEEEMHLASPSNKAKNIQPCTASPCDVSPCLNHGSCFVSNLTHFHCLCLPGYAGGRCEIRQANHCVENQCGSSRGKRNLCSRLPNGEYNCQCSQEMLMPSIGDCGGSAGSPSKSLLTANHESVQFFPGSLVELDPITSGGQALSFELWLMPETPNGIILYAGASPDQKNDSSVPGPGDFAAIILRKGRASFLYDLGSGIANITHPRVLTPGRWWKLRASRVGKVGKIQVDKDQIVSGSSPGQLGELNIGSPLFLGGLDPSVTNDVGKIPKVLSSLSGFSGILQRIFVNGEAIADPFRAARRLSGVRRYRGPPCFPNPCQNGGTCSPILGDFHCSCQVDYTGKSCQEHITREKLLRPIQFDGSMPLEFKNNIYSSVKTESRNAYELVFKVNASTTTGLLLWVGKQGAGASSAKDFLAISLSNGFVELGYNLGRNTRPVFLRSQVKVNDDVWHRVEIRRKRRLSFLQVDDSFPQRRLAAPGASSLNSNGRLWIGGAKNLPPKLPPQYYEGFVGCLKSVRVNGKPLEMLRHMNSIENVVFCPA